MEIWLYVFDFEKAVKKSQKKYDGVDFFQYARECVYKLGCKPFIRFSDIPSDGFSWKKFVDSTCTGIFSIARSCYLQREEADIFIAYRLIDKKHKKDYIMECL